MSVTDHKHRALTVDEYFARLPSRECAEVCEELIDGYYTEATRSGRVGLYRTAFYDYYEGFLVRGQLYRKGAQGEQTGITVNNYHNFIKHRVTMTCQQKLSYDPQAVDGSHRAMEQIRLAKGLLSLYTDRSDIDLDGRLRKATQWCQMYGESYIVALWDETKGKTVALDTESGELVPEGDVSIKVYDPLSVIRDVYRSDSDSDQWYILKEEVNKVDLAVQYPQFEADIMADSLEAVYRDRQIYPCYSALSDIIWKWTLFHDRTTAVPEGRMLTFITSKLVLDDGPLPPEYERPPVHRMAPEDLGGSPWGYTDMFDILPICNAISRLHSTVLTNNTTFGLQHILVGRDSNFTESQLGTGLSLLEWDPSKGPAAKPEAMNLTKSAPETYEYISTLTQTAGTLAGINEVSRGNPDLVLKGAQSGAALALMSTQSIQFNSDLGKAYQSLAERVGTAIIKMLATRSVVPRQGRMLGMSGKPYSKEFKGDDLSLIDKITVKTGNPLAQTTSGRLQIAQSLLDGGFIKNRQDYMQVIETGNLDPMLEAYDMEISLIKDENDQMGQGPIPDAVVFDNHVMHIPEHQVLLASVEARRNPQLIQAVLKHIQSHLGFLAGNAEHGPMNPILASIGNQPTLPPGTPDAIVLPKMPPAAAGPAPIRPPGPRPNIPKTPQPNAVPTPNAGPGMPAQVNLPKPPKGAPIPAQ
jgi:hypothetical protein